MFKQTIILILVFAGFAVAGCNQTVQNRPPQQTSSSPSPQTGSPSRDISQVELANLRVELRSLDRQVREANLAIEELTNRNRDLRNEIEQINRGQADGQRGVVRQEQLDAVAADLRDRMRQANSEQTRQIMAQVSEQIEQLGRTTQAAIDSMARSVSARPSSSPPRASSPSSSSSEFSDDFPKEGITYTVRSGDTLSSIASRNNSTIRDIQNANRISNPERIQVGQVLFIPQRGN